MVVVVFRSRLRENLAATVLSELETLAARAAELAPTMPGFVSYKDFSGPDGESATVVEFESHETLAAWRDHPEHRRVQEFGRREVFAEYQIQVCDLVRTSRFGARAEAGAP